MKILEALRKQHYTRIYTLQCDVGTEQRCDICGSAHNQHHRVIYNTATESNCTMHYCQTCNYFFHQDVLVIKNLTRTRR